MQSVVTVVAAARPMRADFKHAARRFASDATVVTTRADNVSGGRLAGLIRQCGCFAVNVLGHQQEQVARLFAAADRPALIDCLPAVPPGCRSAARQALGASDGEPLLYSTVRIAPSRLFRLTGSNPTGVTTHGKCR